MSVFIKSAHHAPSERLAAIENEPYEAKLFQKVSAIKSEKDVFTFDDFSMKEALEYPDWFKNSFLDLPNDLQEALNSGKRGIVV
jgi:hypothetical protein